jgi:hypothetical protein
MLSAFADCRTIEAIITSQGGASMFVDADFTGTNADLNAADFTNIITSREAIENWTQTNNHYTNLDKAVN